MSSFWARFTLFNLEFSWVSPWQNPAEVQTQTTTDRARKRLKEYTELYMRNYSPFARTSVYLPIHTSFIGICYEKYKNKYDVGRARSAANAKDASRIEADRRLRKDDPGMASNDKVSITTALMGLIPSLAEESVIDEKDFSDKEIKMAYGILNDPRYKQGNYSGAVSAIEKIAKGLSDDPAISKAIQLTNEDLQEGTWAFADKSSEVTALKKLMSKPITLGKEGDDATEVLYSLLGDDELFDDLADAGKKNPKGDARPVIKNWFKQRIKDNSYGMGKDAADLAKKLGLKEEAELFAESIIDDMRDIVDNKQAKKIKGTIVDLFTASAVVQIYDKVNDSNKSKMEKLPLPKLVDLAYKIMKREEINEINIIIENSDKKDAKEMEEIVREMNPKYNTNQVKKEVEQMAMEKYGNKPRAKKIASYIK